MSYNSGLYFDAVKYNTGLPSPVTDYAELEAQPKDLFIDRGDTYSKEFSVFNRDGSVLNLTGYLIAFQLNRYSNDGTVIVGDAVITDAVNGRIKISLSSTATSAMFGSRYVYSIGISDYQSVVTVFRGQALIS